MTWIGRTSREPRIRTSLFGGGPVRGSFVGNRAVNSLCYPENSIPSWGRYFSSIQFTFCSPGRGLELLRAWLYHSSISRTNVARLFQPNSDKRRKARPIDDGRVPGLVSVVRQCCWLLRGRGEGLVDRGEVLNRRSNRDRAGDRDLTGQGADGDDAASERAGARVGAVGVSTPLPAIVLAVRVGRGRLNYGGKERSLAGAVALTRLRFVFSYAFEL